jgi:serine/threonine-protein kinase
LQTTGPEASGQTSLPDTGTDTMASQGQPPFGGSRYRPLHFHARGGLGEVHVAEDTELQRHVAFKRIQARHVDDPDCRRRFLLEAEVTGRLEHPGIVPVYGLVQDAEGRPGYAMRFVEGESLKAAIDRFHKPKPPPPAPTLRQLLNRFVAVCNAVAYAHSRGIVHRDLKPGNIMLGKYGETLIVDWGLAKYLEAKDRETSPSSGPKPALSLPSDAPTEIGSTIGTPAFMSPEQAAGRWDLVGPASDIFSLGATLYALLLGRPPYVAGSVAEILQKARQGEFPLPRRVKSDIPKPLEAVCLKALARRPEDRYASALDLAADVERWLADEPVRAYREPIIVRLGRWGRQHKPVVAAVVALLMTAVVAMSIGLLLLKREQLHTEEQRKLAEEHKQRAEDSYRLARKSMEEVVAKIADDPRAKSGPFEDLRRAALQSELVFYQKFLELRGDEPDFRAERGRAYGQLGFLTKELESNQAATQPLESARDIFSELVRDYPDVPAYQVDLAKCHNYLALLFMSLDRMPEAKQSFEKAVSILQLLSRDHPDTQLYQLELAKTQTRLGSWFDVTGRQREAEQTYAEALEIYHNLRRDDPSGYSSELASVYNNLAIVYRETRRYKQAERAYRDAIAIQDAQAHQAPSDPFLQSELAMSLENLGNLYRDTDRYPEAEKSYQAALDILRVLHRQHPAIPGYQAQLARSCSNLGILYERGGQLAKAKTAYQESIQVQKGLAEKHPDILEYQAGLGGMQCNLGNVLGKVGQLEAAVSSYNQAAQTLEGVLAKAPQHGLGRAFLRNTLIGRASAKNELRLYAEAVQDWDRVLREEKGRDRNRFRLFRAVLLARAGDHVRAIAEADDLSTIKPHPTLVLHDLARVYSLGVTAVLRDVNLPTQERDGLASQYGARAVDLLNQARAAGFFKEDPVRIKQWKANPDFDPIRKREDCAKLLSQLEGEPKATK